MVVRGQQWRQSLALILTLACSGVAFGADATYYVSNSGNDANDGLTPATAWASVSKVNTTSSTFTPGTNVLFERGDIWGEQLIPQASGTALAPIVFGAYGDANAAKPTFFGSDVLQKSNFSLVSGSTYSMSLNAPVGSVFIDQAFMRSADRLTVSSQRLNYTMANPNTWFYDSGAQKLYVNTGGVNPTTDTRQYTAAVRESLITNGRNGIGFQNYLTFTNLATDETARYNGGVGFDIQFGAGIRIENSDSFRGGKHNFSAINADNFVGENLYVSDTMPDQGHGGASAYVAFSDPNQVVSPTKSTWNNIVAENPNGSYPSFITHGLGIGKVIINNLISRSTGVYASSDIQPGAFEMHNSIIDGGQSAIDNSNALIDGLKLTGEGAVITLNGNDIILQNLLAVDLNPEQSRHAVIIDGGKRNTIRFSTFSLRDGRSGISTAVALLVPDTGTKFYGNILDDVPFLMRNWSSGTSDFDSDYNLFAEAPLVTTDFSANMTFDEWLQTVGNPDANSLVSDPMFVDLGNGNYGLLVGSPGIDAFTPAQLQQILTDYFGNARPSGSAFDFGAIEAVPEPTSLAMLGLGAVALLRRRRS